MAKVSSSIELYDRVSAPINKMLAAIDNLIGGFESIESSMNGGFDASKIEEAKRAIDQAGNEMEEMEQNIRQSERQQEKFNQTVKDGESIMDGLGKKVLGLVTAYAGMQTLTKVMDMSDELTATTARIDMMNDGLQTTPELMDLIYQSAQNAWSSFGDMADVVARFGNNAKDAFSSSKEVVDFANLVQKQMSIAGSAEASNALLQLSQALGSGVLRGDELNSIFEQAPNLIQTIADYLNVPIGKIREMAQDGQLSASVVKNAVFAAADEINAKFESMPITWGEVWTVMQNAALMKFQPVLNKVNELANNEKFQLFASGVVNAVSAVGIAILGIFEALANIATFVYDAWSIIEPLLWGVAAAVAVINSPLLVQAGLWLWNTILVPAYTAVIGFLSLGYGVLTGSTAAASAATLMFNNALLASPLTWILLIIIAIVAVFYAVVAAINKVTGSTISATGIILGILTSALSVIWNLFLMTFNLILQNVLLPFTTAWDTFANFFGNIFNDPIATIIRTFENLANAVLGILQSIATAIDSIFGSNLSGAVSGWMSGISGKADELVNKYGNGSYEEKSNLTNQLQNMLNGLQGDLSWNTSDAWNTGYSWGKGGEDTASNLFGGTGENLFNMPYDIGSYDADDMPSNVEETAGNTGSMADSLEITSEDLKYLRDIAEQEAINKFTTAEIKVEMNNNNSISSDMDLDGVVDYLANGVQEAMEKAAEGVHV